MDANFWAEASFFNMKEGAALMVEVKEGCNCFVQDKS
jgi:hypothetical protein|tara:strand:- start:203 stop:313 length:111 start_codon:yes stop_codon:yes gene_type:complete